MDKTALYVAGGLGPVALGSGQRPQSRYPAAEDQRGRRFGGARGRGEHRKEAGGLVAASSTALYLATLACEDSASIDCAREIRGSDSMAKVVTQF
jgi:hypothetical protein